MIWTKFINARVSCGLSIAEADTAGISNAPGEAERQRFFHGANIIPSSVWKGLAFGMLDKIPAQFLYNDKDVSKENYSFANTIDFLCNKAAVTKIVDLLRNASSPIEQFRSFVQWYAGNLPVTPCVTLYAAMVFADAQHVRKPKSSRSEDYSKICAGVMNQAWDLTYITSWNRVDHKKEPGQEFFLATDDNTQKSILVNLFNHYPDISDALSACFPKKQDRGRINDFYFEVLGNGRVNPLANKSEEEQFLLVKEAEESAMQTLLGTT